MKLTLAVAFLYVALLALVPSGNADCCGSWYTYGHSYTKLNRCADCSRVKGYYCAVGSGGCNVFGCNCEGGCRQPTKRKCSEQCCDKRSDREARDAGDFIPVPFMANYTGNDVMNHVDANKDGRLDELEVNIFVTRHGLPADAWRALDKDSDDHLTAHEIDSDLLMMATVKV